VFAIDVGDFEVIRAAMTEEATPSGANLTG